MALDGVKWAAECPPNARERQITLKRYIDFDQTFDNQTWADGVEQGGTA